MCERCSYREPLSVPVDEKLYTQHKRDVRKPDLAAIKEQQPKYRGPSYADGS